MPEEEEDQQEFGGFEDLEYECDTSFSISPQNQSLLEVLNWGSNLDILKKNYNILIIATCKHIFSPMTEEIPTEKRFG